MVENLIISINCVIPIFVMMLAGYIVKLTGKFDDEFFKRVNKFNFYTLLSTNMFNVGYNSDLKAAFDIKLQSFIVIATITIFAISGFILTKTIPDTKRRGTIWQTMFRTNVGIVGLILIQNISPVIGTSAMSVTMTIIVPIFNILTIYSLELCRSKKADFSGIIKEMFKNPLIIGSVFGLLLNICKVPIPDSVCSGIKSLSTTGTTIALICLGSTLDFKKLVGNKKILLICSFLKLVFIPLVAIVVAVLFGFRTDFLAVILVTFASPLATNAYPMAQIYDSDAELTSQLILIQSFLCCFTLFLWIFVLKELCLL